MIDLIYLTVVFPFVGFLINGLFGRKIKNEKIIGIIGSGAVGLGFFITVMAFIETLGLPADQRSNTVELFTWISVAGLKINAAYLVDQLSLTMALIVTGVGFLIHVYSIGYMHGDKAFWRFFAYLNLFIFAMMNLILADNFVLLFLGWEGVGLCSYLLIGFWYDRKFEKGTTSEAAKKAFVVNRIGDFGFLLGMFLIFYTFDSLTFNEVFSKAASFPVSETTFGLIALFLFIGATGKSAQIPLYVWLPDAMAGPTPVSALIHAATMVTAGVYMVSRASIIFASAPAVMTVVAVIGLATAIFAATIGLVQNDIKKVLAYSTVSQLGYMFLAAGVGAFGASIFHVMTHAFFKALLFLGAGSVIHGMHERQDIRHYGGLKKYMPKTYVTFLIASLAIAGFPGFSGFFSKDEILWYSYANGGLFYWIIGAITAMLTAFYIFRLFSLTFLGKERFNHNEVHPHESPAVMTIPLMILAFLSVVGGYIGIPEVFSGEHGNLFEVWLEPVYQPAMEKLSIYGFHTHFEEILLMAISVALALTGIYAALYIYTKKPEIARKASEKFAALYRILLNKYYVDELYEAAVVQPIQKGSEKILWKFTDAAVIDGVVNGTARLIGGLSGVIRKIQNGFVQFYAFIMMMGIAIALLWLILSL
ncbi:NADH dehydrogenase subunit L [Melioribacter roseus P3M-2]|uniref:NADH dehydrogenase subunit L n=1 Tax=Melioribacter roseus (strain DSM 23840 / JCM 17771 / VKM B-2668 / P3M-2) TaxID=1191523 RepID=I6Z2L3_MELRP|nr:NADH-quinone oxidoreductase subunit L [Melioribacter roseus]AFN73380.1 NADH dehydrogenase subunit L [Melioribacter roseus P3M-2]